MLAAFYTQRNKRWGKIGNQSGIVVGTHLPLFLQHPRGRERGEREEGGESEREKMLGIGSFCLVQRVSFVQILSS